MHTHDPELQQFDRSHLLKRLTWSANGPLVRIHLLAFGLASLCHLWLEDASQMSWLPFNIIYLLGLALLWKAGPICLAWGLCALGLAGPLLFARDQLTQSMLLFFMTAIMCLATFVDAKRQDEDHKGYARAIETWRLLTIATYGFAALHKLNRDFLNPTVSCAQYGWMEVAQYWHLPQTLPAWVDPIAPWMIIATELSICVGLLFGARRLIWPLAIVFHIPLTVIMAPAFAFVMGVGHAAFVTQSDLEHFGDRLKKYWKPLTVAALAFTTASLLRHGAMPEWSMLPKEYILWFIGLWCLSVLWKHRNPHRAPLLSKTGKWIPIAALGLYTIHGLTPYFGLQFQHTGAMLSNLRIDRGCWNSCVFPESMRLSEDYIRIQSGYLHTPGHRPKLEQVLKNNLWSPPQLRQMQRNWCVPSNRPFYLKGTYRKRTFEINDVCNTQVSLPFEDAGIMHINMFPDYLRFQKNLAKKCPQPCNPLKFWPKRQKFNTITTCPFPPSCHLPEDPP